MPDHLGSNLNQNQYDAVHHFDSPLIVLAGPGSGKTRVIVHRIAELIINQGAEPESIVALTFTNKAAEEMRRRLAELLNSSAKAERVVASTFHSFGLRLIRQFADLAGLKPEPAIIDEAQQRALIRTVIDEAGTSLHENPFDPYAGITDALRFISTCRNQALFPQDVKTAANQWAETLAANADLSAEARLAEQTKLLQFQNRVELYRRFEEACAQRGWVTFDDLQAQALRLLHTDERVRAIVRTDFSHLVVDEFQDVNRAQIELLKCLAGPHHDLCVVGDDDQAIYGFRGSIPGGFKHVVKHWPNTQTIELTENYRSTAVIIKASAHIIEKCTDRFQPDKTLIAAGPDADLEYELEGVTYTGKEGAGPVIGQMIQHYVATSETQYADCAVLVRTNTELGRIAAALQALEIPIDVPELGSITAHPVVQDLLSWFRIINNGNEQAHLTRLLTRPPFNLSLLTLASWGNEYKKILSILERREKDPDSTTPTDPPEISTQSLAAYLICNKQNENEGIQRFAPLYEQLAIAAETETADTLALTVIHTTGILALDPVNTPAHQVRVEQLGRFLGFIRERMPMLEGNRLSNDFLRYYDDLTAARVPLEIGQTPADRMDEGVTLAQLNAVRILTAHKSKGLEFNTVFIPQINSPTGYPLKPPGAKTETLLPETLLEDLPTSPDDDERRVFFVALTRAKKRAILLAMTKQDNGKNRNPSVYWQNLLETDNPLRVRSAAEVLDEIEKNTPEHPALNTTPLIADNDHNPISLVRAREQFQVRHAVYRIMHDLHTPNLTNNEIATLQKRLTLTTLRLPILAALEPPALTKILQNLPDELRPELTKYAQELVTREPWYELLPPPQGPLQLSFSDIELYLRCPRCFWLRNVVGLPERSTIGANLGSIIHRTLEFFYKRWQQSEADPNLVPTPTLETLRQLGRAAYRDLLDPRENWSAKFERQIENSLQRYWEQLHHQNANPVYLEQNVIFDYEAAGQTHRIRVRMDRIDADENGHHVIDYKTGKITKTKLQPKSTDLQLGIYLLALREFLEDAEPVGSAAYWLLRSGERGSINFDAINLEKICTKIDQVIAGILQGNWDKTANCRNCELLQDEWNNAAEQAEAGISP